MIDYHKQNILVQPEGSGGKFLINCLGLNDQSVFMSYELAQAQINNKFTIQDKISYIFDKLEKVAVTKKWDDLDLSSSKLYLLASNEYQQDFDEIVYKKILNNTVKNCMQLNLNLFVVAHNFKLLSHLEYVWTNSKKIIFINYKNFLKDRRDFSRKQYIDQYYEYKRNSWNIWNQIKEDSWPTEPPLTTSQYNELSDEIRTKFNKFQNSSSFNILDYTDERYNLWHQYAQTHNLSNNCMLFDVDHSYSNIDNFYESYSKCCQFIDVPPYKKEIISQYFHRWKEVILLCK